MAENTWLRAAATGAAHSGSDRSCVRAGRPPAVQGCRPVESGVGSRGTSRLGGAHRGTASARVHAGVPPTFPGVEVAGSAGFPEPPRAPGSYRMLSRCHPSGVELPCLGRLRCRTRAAGPWWRWARSGDRVRAPIQARAPSARADRGRATSEAGPGTGTLGAGPPRRKPNGSSRLTSRLPCGGPALAPAARRPPSTGAPGGPGPPDRARRTHMPSTPPNRSTVFGPDKLIRAAAHRPGRPARSGRVWYPGGSGRPVRPLYTGGGRGGER